MEESEYSYTAARERKKAGFAAAGDVAQARVSYAQFKAALVASEANALATEGALRNILGLPPEDGRRIVPTLPPASKRLLPDWDRVIHMAEERRPDIVELKLIVEADRQQLLQAENQALPQLNATVLYRWNGLSGEMPNGQQLSTRGGQYTDWSVGVNFSVPLGLRQGRAVVRQQRLLIVRDADNVAEGVHEAVHNLAVVVRDLDSAYEQYEAFKEAREAAYENLQIQIEQFRISRIAGGYLNVLQAINDWGNAVSSEAAAAGLQRGAGRDGAADRHDPGDARSGLQRGAVPRGRPRALP